MLSLPGGPYIGSKLNKEAPNRIPGMGIAAKSRILSHGFRNMAVNKTAETAPEAPIEVHHADITVTDHIRGRSYNHPSEIE